jgi:hypothetical protein
MNAIRDRRPASILLEAEAVRECEDHGWMQVAPILVLAIARSPSPGSIRYSAFLQTTPSPRSRISLRRSATPVRIVRQAGALCDQAESKNALNSRLGCNFLRRTGVHFGRTRVRCGKCLQENALGTCSSRTGSIPCARLGEDRQTRRCCRGDRQAGFDGEQTRRLDRNGSSPRRERDKSLPRWRNAATRHGPPATKPELRPRPPRLS